MEVDATLPPLVGSVSVKISPDVTPGGDHAAGLDAKQVEDIEEDVELFAAIETKINSRKWVNKYESQVCDVTSSNCRSLFSMTVLLRIFI